MNVHAFGRAGICSLCSMNKRSFSVKEPCTFFFCDRENHNFSLWFCKRENDKL